MSTTRPSSIPAWFTWSAIFVAVGSCIFIELFESHVREADESSRHPIRPGAVCTIEATGALNDDGVVVGASAEGWGAVNSALRSRYDYGIIQYKHNGLAFSVAPRCRVRILESGPFVSKVLIMSGKHSGRTAWLNTKWCRPREKSPDQS